MEEHTSKMRETAAGIKRDTAAAMSCLMDLYNYFRMDSNMDPLVLYEHLCCLLIQFQQEDAYAGDAEDRPDPVEQYIAMLSAFEYRKLKQVEPPDPEVFLSRPELIRRMMHTAGAVWNYGRNGVEMGPLLFGFLETISRARQTEVLNTPAQTAREIVKLLYQREKQMSLFMNVLDPACGSGAFLAAMLEQVQEERTQAGIHFAALERDDRLRNCVVILTHFYPHPGVVVTAADGGAGLDIPHERFDLILANPPFRPQALRGRDDYGDNSELPIKTNDIHRAFIQRVLQGLKPGGESAIIVPDSFLAHSSMDAIQVRRWIVERFQCMGVVKLPFYTFYPQAAVNASILFIRRPLYSGDTGPARERIFFFTVVSDGFSNDTRRLPTAENDFEELRRIWDKQDLLWEEWCAVSGTKNVHDMNVPLQWDHPNFWFGAREDVRRSDYSLLPEQYQPVQLLSGPVRDPRDLLQDIHALGMDILELTRQLMEAEYDG